jgi:hypothetical protein
MDDTCMEGCLPRCIGRIAAILDRKPKLTGISTFLTDQSLGLRPRQPLRRIR